MRLQKTRIFVKKIVYKFKEHIKLLIIRLGFRRYSKLEVFNMKSYPVTYLVNSKVACSSIKHLLMSLDGVDLSMIKSYRQIHMVSRIHGYQKFGKDSIPPNNQIFTVVRNPYDRLESLFRNKFVAIEKDTWFEFEFYLNGVFELNERFESFLDKVIKIDENLAEKHFISQSSLVKEVNCSHIGKIEDIEETWDFLRGIVGRDFPSPAKQNETMKVTVGVKIPGSHKKQVYNRYKEDFEFFNYDEKRGGDN